MDNLIYPELSYKIVGLLFEVYNKLGYGLREKDYQKAISIFLSENNIIFQEQVSANLKINNQNIRKYYLDFIIDNKIVLGLKTENRFNKNNIAQIYSYLKSTNKKLGIIANFSKYGVKFKRIVNIK